MDTNPSYGKGIDPEAIDSVAAEHMQAVQNRATGNYVVEWVVGHYFDKSKSELLKHWKIKSVNGGVGDAATCNIDNTEHWRGAAEEGRRNQRPERAEAEVNLKLLEFI